MLQHIQLLRNIGSFDSITPGAAVPFDTFNLIYAENGRGKTTLAALLRSLDNGDADLVLNRHRLGATHPPHAILSAGGATYTFQNGTWSARLPSIAVFDDYFVDANVCSGIAIDTEHRQNLHELILGAHGVALSAVLQGHIAGIQEHNRQLRLKEDAIPAAAKGSLTTDQFCALQPDPKIDEKIGETERALAAARESQRVNAEPVFENLALPEFDIGGLERLLTRDLAGLDREAAAKVQAHLATLGAGGERWANEGMNLMRARGQEPPEGDCPFCAQPLSNSAVIEHYRAYFSAGYADLKAEVAEASRMLNTQHRGEVLAAFERDVRVTVERREFWARFANIPAFAMDTAAAALAWKTARDALAALVAKKLAAPLDRVVVDDATKAKVAAFDITRRGVTAAIGPLLAQNHEIALVKEKARTADAATLTADLAKLSTLKHRFSVQITPLCDAYSAEKVAKAATERARSQARRALEQYRTKIFPAYQGTINDYLGRFGAGFRLENVGPVNTNAGSSATYTVLINNQPVGLTNANGPSFKNTLSSGDRNALALAFFFASLEQDPALADKIVVIDDPMTSLDEHRTLVTVEEVVKMARRVRQVIVLSHSKPFLLSLWKSGPKNSRTAMRISRVQNGSNFEAWRASDDAITEHDRRYARVRAYVSAADPAIERTVAADLRPMLEAWGRVAYPMEFPPEEILGGFVNRCEQVVGTARQIMKQGDIDELKGLTNYANLFHHDTNPTYQTEHISDQQLAQFCARTLAFIRKA